MSSQKLLRNLLDAALAADLEKNELRVFLALLKQTIGYGKAADPLTMGRLSQLTGIRKDRISKAISRVIDKQLFSREAHSWLDFTYSIPSCYFEGEMTSRFFAPSVPLGGELPRSVGQETHSAGTYRDTPIQSSNLNSTDKSDIQQVADSVACDVDVESFSVEAKPLPEKPLGVDVGAYQKLLPALKTLSGQQATEILQLLELSVQEGSIRTSQERMGGGLIKAARQGTLDTSRLADRDAAEQRKQANEQAEQARQQREKVQERAHLEQLAKMAGVPVSTLLGVRDEQ